MSVIVGIVHEGGVYIGADSQITSGGTKKIYRHQNNYKVWHPDGIKDLLIGSSGLIKGINTIKTINGLIDQKTLFANGLDYEYVIKHLTKKIMDSMEDVKLIDSKDYKPTMPNEFLFANKDELYMISVDGAVIQIDDFGVIGSGTIEATGSLLATENFNPKRRIIKAIEVAIQNDIYVGYPIIIMNTLNDDIDIINKKTI
jgi:ATP-dependent protease HslVU (ClpYQ) peptidase subunit